MGWFTAAAPAAPAAPAPTPAQLAAWKETFAGCGPALEVLAQAGDEESRLAARAWWVICIASRCGERCAAPVEAFREQAASFGVPSKLEVKDTQQVVQLAAWPALERCVLEQGREAGVAVEDTLEHVEQVGVRQQALQRQQAGVEEWARARADVEVMRKNLQTSFLIEKGIPISTSAANMGVDELRVCQVYMYGLGSRLRRCQRHAQSFAEGAAMDDVNAPLKGYDEQSWSPELPQWQAMEACVHAEAEKAGGEFGKAWRGDWTDVSKPKS